MNSLAWRISCALIMTFVWIMHFVCPVLADDDMICWPHGCDPEKSYTCCCNFIGKEPQYSPWSTCMGTKEYCEHTVDRAKERAAKVQYLEFLSYAKDCYYKRRTECRQLNLDECTVSGWHMYDDDEEAEE